MSGAVTLLNLYAFILWEDVPLILSAGYIMSGTINTGHGN